MYRGRRVWLILAYTVWLAVILYGLWLIQTNAWTTPPAY